MAYQGQWEGHEGRHSEGIGKAQWGMMGGQVGHWGYTRRIRGHTRATYISGACPIPPPHV